MSMPVRSLKGSRLAAMADVGAVFSEMKFSVVPENCFHSSVEAGVGVLVSSAPLLHAESQPGRVRAAAPAPPRRRTCRRESPRLGRSWWVTWPPPAWSTPKARQVSPGPNRAPTGVRSGREPPRAPPAAGRGRVAQAVVQPARPALPELDRLGHEPEPAPAGGRGGSPSAKRSVDVGAGGARAPRGPRSPRPCGEAQAPSRLPSGRLAKYSVGLLGARPARPVPRPAPGARAAPNGITSAACGLASSSRPLRLS